MQRSSSLIASLAAALAKAQAELVNPGKSQVATMRRKGEGARTDIPYAPPPAIEPRKDPYLGLPTLLRGWKAPIGTGA